MLLSELKRVEVFAKPVNDDDPPMLSDMLNRTVDEGAAVDAEEVGTEFGRTP